MRVLLLLFIAFPQLGAKEDAAGCAVRVRSSNADAWLRAPGLGVGAHSRQLCLCQVLGTAIPTVLELQTARTSSEVDDANLPHRRGAFVHHCKIHCRCVAWALEVKLRRDKSRVPPGERGQNRPNPHAHLMSAVSLIASAAAVGLRLNWTSPLRNSRQIERRCLLSDPLPSPDAFDDPVGRMSQPRAARQREALSPIFTLTDGTLWLSRALIIETLLVIASMAYRFPPAENRLPKSLHFAEFEVIIGVVRARSVHEVGYGHKWSWEA